MGDFQFAGIFFFFFFLCSVLVQEFFFSVDTLCTNFLFCFVFQKGRADWVPSLAIYVTRMDFDWPAFVEDNQNNTSRLGEERV